MSHNKTLVTALTCIIFCVALIIEAEAVRPPLKPLDIQTLREMIAGSEMIAIGTVAKVTISKTLEAPLEIVVIRVNVKPEKILKGDKTLHDIEIEEIFKQFSEESMREGVSVKRAGPSPPVGRYHEGTRIFVFLQSTGGSKKYRPLGSGNHDAYLGVFQITAEGVNSDRYRFGGDVLEHAASENGFLHFITSLMRGLQ